MTLKHYEGQHCEMTRSNARRAALLAAFLGAALLFVLDLYTANLTLWEPYLLPLLVVYLWGRRRDLYAIAAFCTLLIALSLILEPGQAASALALLIHLLQVVLLWLFAWLLGKRLESDAQRRRQAAELADQVQTRTAALAREVEERRQAEGALRDLNGQLEARVAQRTADLEAALADVQSGIHLKDEFMATVSFELRTPLSGVLSMAEMLEERGDTLDERQHFYVRNIRRSGERLLQVVNGILSYTQLVSGRVHLERAPCRLEELLAISAAAIRPGAEARQQSLAVQVDPPDLSVQSDATAIVEILNRLLDNAVKFTPAGGSIGLAAQAAPAQPGAPDGKPAGVQLVVWDTGPGLDAAQLDYILAPFHQGDGLATRRHKGMGLGLGLAYVREMVLLLGGRLDLESTPGQGSRFTVTLPSA